jgi:hypothetical protein
MASYRLELSLEGGNMNLIFKDSVSKWTLGPDSNFRVIPTNPMGCNVHVDTKQSTLSLTSDDFKTSCGALLTIAVETPRDKVDVAVDMLGQLDKLVLVKSDVDSFRFQQPGNHSATLRLK